MEDQDQQDFSWTTLFTVSGVSFLSFTFLLRLLDAASGHITIFNWVGTGALFLGLLISLSQWLTRKAKTETSGRKHD